MARPRFNGRGYTNPLNPLGFHSENRYRETTPLGNNFMSNEANFAQHYQAETKVFHAGIGAALGTTIKTGAKAGIRGVKWSAKMGIKGGKFTVKQQEQFFEVLVKELPNAVAKKVDDLVRVGGKTTDEAVAAVNDLIAKNLDEAVNLGKISKEAADALKQGAKGGIDDALRTGVKGGAEGAEQGLRNAAKRLPWLRIGGATGLAVGGVYIAHNISSALGAGAEEWVNDFTGANCDEKALAQGLESGTEEYQNEVADCQDDAAKRIMAMTGVGLLAIFGFLYIVIKK